MAYTTINKPSATAFNTKLYEGTSGTVNVTGLSFQPDFCWLKNRDAGNRNALFDSVRGVTKRLRTDGTDAEVADPDTLTSFNSDGFTVGADADGYGANQNGASFTSWNWKANGAGSANTDGSINTTYTSANTTAGFSIIQYTGNGSAGATIGHGLGTVPKMFIVKKISSTGAWNVYHEKIGNTGGISLDLTGGTDTNIGYWNNTSPTSSVLSLGSSAQVNGSGVTYICYVFSEKQGYSKFSSYTGNGNADGTFSYTGFKPAFVMLKKTSGTGNWQLFDNKRAGYNPDNDVLRPNLSNVECTSCVEIDMLSNGYKLKNTDGDGNTSGGTYIYMAFAEAPLVGTNGVTAKAR